MMRIQGTKNVVRKLLYFGNELLLEKQGDYFTIPTFEQLPDWIREVKHEHAIGTYNNSDCYVAEASEKNTELEPYIWVPIKSAIEFIGVKWFGVVARAYQIINWDKNHQYCGRCGHETKHTVNTFERRCESCRLFFFPRISPSIIVLVRKDNQILLARKAQFSKGVYALIAGFVEAGESVEEALHREVKEEVGINVKNIRYFSSQTWPFPDSLMLAFTAEYAGGEINLTDGELEAAGWYDINSLPGLPASSISISRKLIDSFIAEYQ